MSRLLVAIGSLVLIGGFGPAPQVDANAVAEVARDGGRMEENEALRFRAEMGLASDLATVRASYSDGVTYSSDDFGLPLTAAENAELLRRAGVQHAAGPAVDIASRLATYGEHFGPPRPASASVGMRSRRKGSTSARPASALTSTSWTSG